MCGSRVVVTSLAVGVAGVVGAVLATPPVASALRPVLAAAPAAPRVEAMVVGRERVLAGPLAVGAQAARIVAGGRRCAVGAGTPLAVLAAVDRAGGPAFRTRDYGSCSRRPRDAGGLFVTAVGGERNRGRDGWVYKVGPRAGTTPAADPTGPLGDGRALRAGQRVVWFWCRLSRHDSCQRTLELEVARRAAPGAPVRVRVRGYDDNGHAVDVAGAQISFRRTYEYPPGRAVGRTGADGRATLVLPAGGGSVAAVKEGLVPSFGEPVAVA